ncbi:aromatic ring-hydroxylating dioxygenase subunit alpha [uncultured Tateyamaria sp.]|uniref:aromatic ring-hydroxylating oxygenase subunit alpha n=1 Tax=uncultured Tateyamaria sp. TaxID=455651 RepID=UPI00260A32EC|nr:aromatic ring-hydroxylating dioxygenase subunit alpha [uncultured Tateyamaria sp.]
MLAREVETLFRKFPIIMEHAEQLPELASYFTNGELGVPILITRNNDGVVKAFMNVCCHRGARLTSGECGKAKTFACPYHKWTYDLNGNLRGLPHASGFGDIDKKALGLVELPAFERFGLIWARPSAGEGELDPDAWIAPMAEQLASRGLENHVVFRAWSLDRKMNWHLALEGFQESYHFCGAHEHTACAAYLGNQSSWIDKCPHVRHSVPLPSIVDLKDTPQEEWQHRQHFMTPKYIFPLNYVRVMTDYVYIYPIKPRDQTPASRSEKACRLNDDQISRCVDCTGPSYASTEKM